MAGELWHAWVRYKDSCGVWHFGSVLSQHEEGSYTVFHMRDGRSIKINTGTIQELTIRKMSEEERKQVEGKKNPPKIIRPIPEKQDE